MNKKTYIKRLKSILGSAFNTLNERCPGRENPYYGLFTNDACILCQRFVKLKPIKRNEKNYGKRCPCLRPDCETAVKRAWKYIKLYEEIHGEVK